MNQLHKRDFELLSPRDSGHQVSRDGYSQSCLPVLCKCGDFQADGTDMPAPSKIIPIIKTETFNGPKLILRTDFLLCLWQTEFLNRCKDMPLLAGDLQKDGKLLTETVIHVNPTRLTDERSFPSLVMWFFILIIIVFVLSLPLQAIAGGSPRGATEPFSDVLLNLNRHCPALLPRWLNESLQAAGFPAAQVSAEQKQSFIQQLLR